MKMKLKLGPIAILLIVINGNACFAEPQSPRQIIAWPPNRNKCLDLLELEKVEVDPQHQTISGDTRLLEDYHAVESWLKGFFTAWNVKSASNVGVKEDVNNYQMMSWMLSYCRTHPSKTLLDAAKEFTTRK